jgi:hypothetical protein
VFAGLDKVFIYVLIDPVQGLVRYVGKTHAPYFRLRQHLVETGAEAIRNWLDELGRDGVSPVMAIVDVTEVGRADESELEWIQHFMAITPPDKFLNTKRKARKLRADEKA